MTVKVRSSMGGQRLTRPARRGQCELASAQMKGLARIVPALAAVTAWGCTRPATEILVVVDSNLARPAQLHRIRVEVIENGEPRVTTEIRDGGLPLTERLPL